MSRASWRTLQFDKILPEYQVYPSFFPPKMFYSNNHYVPSEQFPIYTKRPHPSIVAIPSCHPFSLPMLDLQRWEWDFPFNLCDILIPSPDTCLILCENAKIISCLWGSAFWTPAVALCLKQGPDPENNYFGSFFWMWELPFRNAGFNPIYLAGIGEMGSQSNKLWRFYSLIHHFSSWKEAKSYIGYKS